MKLFDSIAHPTLTGSWFGKQSDNTFEKLAGDYKKNNIAGGCAVSLPFIDTEELKAYYKKCKEQQDVIFYPVAAFNFTEPDFEQKIAEIKAIGYEAIKIHIRLSGINPDTDFEKLKTVFQLCEKHGLIIFFCTYYHTTIEHSPLFPLTHYLTALLKAAPGVKIILLHGGDVSLMQMVQLARFNPNVLIDLSYTFIKFKGSSLDADIAYLLNNFDRKICFGSDYPEYSIDVFKEQFEALISKVSDVQKIENFSYKNIMNFLKIEA